MDITKFKVGDAVGICPKCHDELIIKDGKFGLFVGCNNYPNCKKTFDYEGFRVNMDLVKLNTHNDFKTLHKLKTTSEDKKIRNRAEEKLIIARIGKNDGSVTDLKETLGYWL